MNSTIPDIILRAVPNCDVVWAQRVLNHAHRIIVACDSNDVKIDDFFKECEKCITAPDSCRITWNTEVQRFGGDEFEYVFYFFSNVVGDIPIKVSATIDIFTRTIFIGHMQISTRKEKRKLDKFLSPTPTKDILDSGSFDSPKTQGAVTEG